MDPAIVAALIGGTAGLATGVAGSLIAPWSNWGVEKRRIRLQRRQALVDDWRLGIRRHLASNSDSSMDLVNQYWYNEPLARRVDRQRRKDQLGRRRFLPLFVRKQMAPPKDATLRRHPLPKDATPGRSLSLTVDGVESGYFASVVHLAIEDLARRWRID